MTIDGIVAAQPWASDEKSATFEAMGAAERRIWSSFVRQTEIKQTLAAVEHDSSYGAVVVGPWGVGKSTLARAAHAAIAETTHVVRLFGSPAETLISYGSLAVLLARLPAAATESPSSIIRGIDELLRRDADGRQILLVIDDLPGLDPMSVGVIMHLLLSHTAKALIVIREIGQLPEDLVWLVKDGFLEEIRLNYFSRDEVGTLIAKATKTFVSETAVTALYNASQGIPLVLQALFREQVANGRLQLSRGGWVISGVLNLSSTSVLAETVMTRLARETDSTRSGIEKMSLLGRASLPVAISVLGQETVWELEERGYLLIDAGERYNTQLSERYLGEMVRSTLTPERMTELLQEIAAKFSTELQDLQPLEIMALAAWSLDAGLGLEPVFGLRAASHAVRHFDPVLALRCTAHVPRSHAQGVKAVQTRAAAHKIMADYGRAVDELEAVPDTVLAELPLEEYAAWAFSTISALLWVPGGYGRITQLLEEAGARIEREAVAAPPEAAKAAWEWVRLSYLEYMVHSGGFAAVVDELEGLCDPDDPGMGSEYACLLVPVLSVLGRELEAIELGRRIEAEVDVRGESPLLYEYAHDGVLNALIWSGKWLECVDLLLSVHGCLPHSTPYRGGLIELKLGLAHVYAGHGAKAADLLMAATAQLEVRESNNVVPLAYAALAFACAQNDNEADARRYLELAGSGDSPTSWTNLAMEKFLRLMALRWLNDPGAAKSLQQSAREDIAQKRYTTASISLFASVLQATEREYVLLEEVSLRRQGPMPAVNIVVARSCQTRNAAMALEAADLAREMELYAVESLCTKLALDFAKEGNEYPLAREARSRVEALRARVARFPYAIAEEGVKLTPRELQVATLTKQGLGNRAIADRIGLSVRTVEGHLYQVYTKLGITSRQELEQYQNL